MNKEQLSEKLLKEYSVFIVNKILKLSDAYNNLEAFFSASKGDLMAKYNEVFPGKKHLIGHKFFEVLGQARSYYLDDKYAKNHPESALNEKNGSSAEKAVEEIKRKMFTPEELKAVAAMMELCDIAEIDICRIIDILGAVRLKGSADKVKVEVVGNSPANG